ncbi:PEPxxWA-CTERM sorting domain-containing protein [Phenylobacterium sp.]|uniref:PEPxxWA-CTERM sorting domain-containing protein n=1 Tax=Phenylobacterium sp. TaxID=1871053 RepID=UPI00286B9142|nr:PEPxxWA-CTERM sorting domain-containing protein [Phenylobacterium sp.]
MSSKLTVLALSTLAALAVSASAHATEFVSNGGFEATTLPVSSQFGGQFPSQQVTSWSTNGYNWVYRPGEADTVGGNGKYGNVSLWGPGKGVANGMTASSPNGGNFLASDPSFEIGSIDQTVTGLVAGQTYKLSFYWAAAQQFGFNGPTTEGWDVSLGAETHSTGVVSNANHGFVPWKLATMSFTATGASETLSFLAKGGPSGGQPPFALLDGVSLKGGVPEPAAWALMIMGLGSVGAAARRRRSTAATA